MSGNADFSNIIIKLSLLKGNLTGREINQKLDILTHEENKSLKLKLLDTANVVS